MTTRHTATASGSGDVLEPGGADEVAPADADGDPPGGDDEWFKEYCSVWRRGSGRRSGYGFRPDEGNGEWFMAECDAWCCR